MKEFSTAIQLIPLEHYLILCVALFSIGLMGVLFRRNTIIILMCIELMFNSVTLLFGLFGLSFRPIRTSLRVFYHDCCCCRSCRWFINHCDDEAEC